MESAIKQIDIMPEGAYAKILKVKVHMMDTQRPSVGPVMSELASPHMHCV